MSILDDIVAYKKEELKQDKKQYPLQFFLDLIAGGISATRNFSGSLSQTAHIAVIAELKFASPSRGILNKRENLAKIIESYETGGAQAISVLTERDFFQGETDDIRKVKRISSLPVLRKDFIIEEYQIYQSRCLGADAILLIARLLNKEQLLHFQEIACSLAMDCVVEVHNKEELERVIETKAKIIGINNRNLEDFSIDLSTTMQLAPLIPRECLLISESGIGKRQDVKKLSQYGIDAVLVGESLVAASQPRKVLKDLSGILKNKKKRRKQNNVD